MLFTLLIDFSRVKPGYLIWGENRRVKEEVKADKGTVLVVIREVVCVGCRECHRIASAKQMPFPLPWGFGFTISRELV